MKRIYIDINTPTNTEEKAWISKLKGTGSVIIKRSKGGFVDMLLFPVRKVFANAKFDIACMAGALAEVIYRIPEEIRNSVAENIAGYHMKRSEVLVYYNLVVMPIKNFGEQVFLI